MNKFIIKSLKLLVILYFVYLFFQFGFMVPAKGFADLEQVPVVYKYNVNPALFTDKYPGQNKIPIVHSCVFQGKGVSYDDGLPYNFRFRQMTLPAQSFVRLSEYSWMGIALLKRIDSFVDNKGAIRQGRRVSKSDQLTVSFQFILFAENIWIPDVWAKLPFIKQQEQKFVLNTDTRYVLMLDKTGLPEMLIFDGGAQVAKYEEWQELDGLYLPTQIVFYEKEVMTLRLRLHQSLFSSDKSLWELKR